MQKLKSGFLNSVNINKNKIVEGAWPLLSSLSVIVIQIFTLKIITNFISTDNYGKASLVMGILMLLNTLIIGPLMVTHNRLYFDYVQKSMLDWYKKYFKILILEGIILIAILYLIIALIYFVSGNNLYISYLVPVSILALVTPFLNEETDYIEAERKQKKLAIVNNLQKLLFPLFVLLLLFISLNQITTIIIAQSFSILASILLFRFSFKYKKFSKLSYEDRNENVKILRKEIFSFGWYLPLGYFVMWLLSTSDRYLLEHFRSAKEVGVYAVNYGLWAMPFMILNGWLEVWTRPHIYDRASKNEWRNVKSIVLKRVIIGSSLSFVSLIVIIFYSDLICYLLLEQNYLIDKNVIILIAVAHFFQLLGYSILPVFISNKNLRINFVALLTAAVINLALNFLIIPIYGMYGAALSTLIGYVIWAIILAFSLLNFFKKNLNSI